MGKRSKRIYGLLVLLFLTGGYAFSQAKPRADYNYLVYLPKDYAEQTRNYPIVFYLHGG